MSAPITLYDIPSTAPGNAWSPNVWKARYVLNYKGLPYQTEWVEYPDIELLYAKTGTKSHLTKRDGVTSHYTLPVLHDASTGAVISDSAEIARYLDKTYPDTPTAIPLGTDAFHYAFNDALENKFGALCQFTVVTTFSILNPRSQGFFRDTKEKNTLDGRTLEEAAPKGVHKEKEWARLRNDFGKIDAWMKEDKYFMGDVISYADFSISGWLLWVRIIYGADSEEWKDILTWHGGRWGAL
ncbi:uncharacterized protein BT62DRAFT_981875 [Guyanagaster necrorhizus]|uniref:GST N-terminal domain-containing protein n=1 Tax=Guyanagaster necrorhizus TaxID=856835 RepID=A0A9P7VP91_9AGAR|nr:uncharacterized protein BT62DRAFT_981875 [Guyanagaster necrorhizus MCA 3950]KAG7443970.1 hypothetical protein BT62DRAFT_981875 [Guyanagaster necrorhizus MCA 3950]